MNHRHLACTIAALALFVCAGCDGPELHDSIDLELDFELTPSDELHLPYVTGAQVTLSATDGDGDDPSDASWTLSSSNPGVLRIDSQSRASAQCTAVSAGVSVVAVHDETGEVIHEAEIEVADPDRWVMYPHGPMIVGYESSLAFPEVDVLAGGTATFLVEYYRGEQRLYGHGALGVATATAIDASPLQTFLFEDREWLQVTPQEEGDHPVELQVNGRAFGGLLVRAVGRDAVDSVDLVHEAGVDFEELEQGTMLTVLGRGRGESGGTIYGVEFSWDVDGDGVPGLGDLFRYEFAENVRATLGAEFDGMRSEIEIRGREGYVDSSNDLGCALGAGRPVGSTGLWLLFAAATLGLARARRRA